MANFAKLLKTSGGTLARAQAEQDALAQGALTALQRAAEARYAAQAEPLTMYHGSPHVFDRFDFETNYGAGEGAQAYGPGGYLTGNEPLARSYAKKLYDKHARPTPAVSVADQLPPHNELRRALTLNPEAAAEYVRAKQVKRLMESWADLSKPRVDVPWRGDPALDVPYGIQEYIDAVGRQGLQQLPTRVGRGGLSAEQVVAMGSAARDAAARSTGPTPRLVRRALSPEDIDALGRVQSQYDYLALQEGAPRATQLYADVLKRPVSHAGGLSIPALRHNLNAVRNFEAGPAAGPARAKMSMAHPRAGSAGYVDLRSPGWVDPATVRPIPASPGLEGLERSLYEAQGPSFAQMLAHDYPLRVNTPEVLGALEQIARARGVPLTPHITGKEALEALRLYKGGLEAKRVLREAGVPGLYFERGGRRGGGAPAQLDPDDYNFVIFDDSALAPPLRKPFSAGGAVA